MTAIHPAPLPPLPPGLPLLGNFLEFRRDAHRAMTAWRQRHGDLIRFRLGPQTFHMASHPALAEDILMARQDQFVKIYSPQRPRGLALVLGQGLLTSSGDLWRRQRRTIQPLFTRSRVAEYADEIVAAGRGLAERWQALPAGSQVDIGQEMMRATLEAITRTMFNTSVTNLLDRLSPTFLTLLQYASSDMRSPLRLPAWLPTPQKRAFREAMEFLDALIYGFIRDRRATGERRDDQLDRLIHARDEESGEPMNDRQIRDEVITIFTAGHETTALALTWSWYLLARHPEARLRLEEELDGVLGERDPAMEDVPRLNWARAVIEESLRLYPPASIVVRRNVGDTVLGGYAIPKDAMVIVNIANIHRHGEFWPAADEFSPERFLRDDDKPGHRLAYMPFGAGQRVCVGNAFALIESILLLALLARRFRLELQTDRPVEPELEVTLRPKGRILMNVSRR